MRPSRLPGLFGLLNPFNPSSIAHPLNPNNPVTRPFSSAFSLISPNCPLNPLHPSHPLNPALVRASLRQPPGPLPADEGSRLELLRANTIGNSEWWWTSGQVRARDAQTGAVRNLDIITNQQVFGGMREAVGLVQVRDLDTAEVWRLDRDAPMRGMEHGRVDLALDGGERMRFEGDRYDIALGDRYGERVSLHMSTLHQSIWGDQGWLDNNPRGAFPLWASYTSRALSVSGTLYLHDSPRDGRLRELVIESGEMHFDHQSIHNDLALVSSQLSSLAIAGLEATALRPSWDWFRAKLDGGTRMMAYSLFNHAGAQREDEPDKVFISLVGPSGRLLRLDGFSLTTRDVYEVRGLQVPRESVLRFDVPHNDAGIEPGAVEMRFSHQPRGDTWLISYRIGRLASAPLMEAPSQVTYSRSHNGNVVVTAGHGTHEVANLGLLKPTLR